MTFWRGKKVFLTGHTGFKGSWLSLWLQELGADVFGFSLAPEKKPNLFQLAGVATNMHSMIGDIRDFVSLKKILQKHSPEIIIHMAAQSLVRYSYQEPLLTYATNVMGTVNLLEAARQLGGVKVFINVTSDKCYENNEMGEAFSETDRLGGLDPYSNSKACSELVARAYAHSYFNKKNPTNELALASARAGNVIGGGDFAEDRLLPDILRACLEDKPLQLRFPHAIRPWQHVLEPLSGYLLLAEKLYSAPTVFAEAWNFGPNSEDIQSVSWIVEYVSRFWKKNLDFHLDPNANQLFHEATSLRLNCEKAKRKLGWLPRWNLEKALEQTLKWYRAYQAKENMREVTLSQISQFLLTNKKAVYE